MTAAGPQAAATVEPLQLSHRDWMEPLLMRTGSPLSEFSFANLFLFRERHDYRLVDDDPPWLLGRTYDGERHAMPLGPIDARSARAMLKTADCLYPVGERGPEVARQLGLASTWRDADSDYVYEAARLAELRGAKVKRAQAKAFAADGPNAEELGPDQTLAAESVLDGWLADLSRTPDETDYHPCREALVLQEALGLEGLLVRLKDRTPVAFMLASRGADGGRIVHFAKGRRAHAGAYPWMFARFAQGVQGCRINFEQDLGRAGFAQAKRAFAPVARLRKYRLSKSP